MNTLYKYSFRFSRILKLRKPGVFLYILWFLLMLFAVPTLSPSPQSSLFPLFRSFPHIFHLLHKKRAFKHVKRAAFQTYLNTKLAAFPAALRILVTWNAHIFLFIYLFYSNIRKSRLFQYSPVLIRFNPVYPVHTPL